MLRSDLPILYPITDVPLSGLSHAEQIARLNDGGVTFVQLREKRLAPRAFYRAAVVALRVARARGMRVIINDRVDIALALGADGVHLGQDDLPPEAARRLLGPTAIIGLSTHTVEQARAAAAAALHSIDYLAVGPIFATSSKESPDPVIGLDTLRLVRQYVGARVPIVAIGGITHRNVRQTLDAGADAVAVISALIAGDPAEIASRVRRFFAAANTA